MFSFLNYLKSIVFNTCEPKPIDLSFIKFEPSVKDESLDCIVIVQGLFSSKNSFEKIGKEFSELGRTVYIPDIRCHGDFKNWCEVGEFSYQAMISDLNNFLQKNDIKRCILIGHSLGGVIAGLFAAKNPDLVSKLIIIDISPLKRVTRGEEATIVMQTFSGFLKKLITDLNSEEIADMENGRQKLEEVLKKKVKDESCIKEISDQLDKRDGKLCWKFDLEILDKFLHDYDAVEKFESKYMGPVMIIYGCKSRIFKIDEKDSIIEIMPNIVFKAIEQAGHNLHNTHTEEFLKEVVPFLNN